MRVCISTARTMARSKASQPQPARGQGKPVLPCSKAGERGTGFRSKDLGGAVCQYVLRASGEATTWAYTTVQAVVRVVTLSWQKGK